MFFKKEGLPEVGEVVLCTVKRILPNCAFVSLEEYKEKEAMLHISEVSTKWVKSIRDFISEGRLIVCKVLQKDEAKGYVDVSLKRASAAERKEKLAGLKAELRIEKLIEQIAKKFGEEPREALTKIGGKIVDVYGSLHGFYYLVRKDGVKIIEDINLEKKWAEELKSQLTEYIRSQKVMLKRILEVKSFSEDGVERLRTFFKRIKEICTEKDVEFNLKYMSAPKYSFEIKVKDYKSGEIFLNEIFQKLSDFSKKKEISFSVCK